MPQAMYKREKNLTSAVKMSTSTSGQRVGGSLDLSIVKVLKAPSGHGHNLSYKARLGSKLPAPIGENWACLVVPARSVSTAC